MGKKKTPSRTVGDTPIPPITKRSLNPAIIDDNIAKLEKAIKAGDVTPNPSGTSEETLLTTIGIDGKKYDIGASAENVSYDNTDSGLIADDVQGAIDEIVDDIKVDAVTSGLTPETGSTIIGFKGEKQSSIIVISAIIQTTFSAYSSTKIANLPEAVRPGSSVRTIVSNTTKDTQINATIDSNGDITVYPTSANADLSAQNLSILTTYF